MLWPFDPLDGFAVVPPPGRTRVDATHLATGQTRPYTVVHHDNKVIKIVDASGGYLARQDPQFTEVAEAFHIDYEHRK